MIEILYQDKYIIAVNKPCGMLVHRSSIAKDESLFLLQELRNQIGQYLYPIHRIDRPTSGIVLFAFDSATAALLNTMLINGGIQKSYYALIRGWIDTPLLIDHPVKNEKGKSYDAQTHIICSDNYVYQMAMGRYQEQRYAIIKIHPLSGRWHQIRQHLAHARHYIINDRVHGDGKHNNLITQNTDIQHMFLHAQYIKFTHPYTLVPIEIEAPFPPHWEKVKTYFTQ